MKNEIRKRIVLAFQGLKLNITDFEFASSQHIKEFINSKSFDSLLKRHYEHTFNYVKQTVQDSQKSGYSLSFTGYSFGSWLAVLSVFFCHKNFKKFDVEAFTFESPGTLKMLEVLNSENPIELNNLKITNYLLEINLFNTCDNHIGETIRIKLSNQNWDESQNLVFGESNSNFNFDK